MFTFNKEKKYFNQKAIAVQKMIWDLEFKREKTLLLREEVRGEYDSVSTKWDMFNSRINSQQKDATKICVVHNPEKGNLKVHKDKGTCACELIENHMPITDLEGLYDQRERLEKDKERYISQMKRLDLDVNGSPKTNEFPDGEEGINQNLDALRELLGMVRDYRNKR